MTHESKPSGADWHRARRAAILRGPAGDAVRALGRPSRWTAVVAGGMQLLDLGLAAWCGLAGLPVWAIVLLAYGPGAWCAMARFAFLHETVHGIGAGRTKRVRHLLLRLGDLPTMGIANYVYYRWGHIDHHRRLGRDSADRLETTEGPVDLDLLFQTDTMTLSRAEGERPTPPPGWRRSAGLNLLRITARQLAYSVIDVLSLPVMVVTGFPYMRRRGPDFLRDTRLQAALVCAQIALIGLLLGWPALLYLFLAQTFFYIPIHPYFAYFSATHGAPPGGARPQPTMSIDGGRWFTVATFALDHHVEHHDFPNVPWYRLPKLRRLAPAFYPAGQRHAGVFSTIGRAMRAPPIYAAQGLELDDGRPPAG